MVIGLLSKTQKVHETGRESLLSVSKVAMSIPTTLNQPLELKFDIRDDESTFTTFDVLDDSIPIVEGVPTNTFL